jgi:hypothetical protein
MRALLTALLAATLSTPAVDAGMQATGRLAGTVTLTLTTLGAVDGKRLRKPQRDGAAETAA